MTPGPPIYCKLRWLYLTWKKYYLPNETPGVSNGVIAKKPFVFLFVVFLRVFFSGGLDNP